MHDTLWKEVSAVLLDGLIETVESGPGHLAGRPASIVTPLPPCSVVP